jgi:hypothetical protein
MNLQSWSQLHSGSHAESRLTLGQTLLALKHQNAHKNLGYHHFSHFLNAGVLPFKHTILRQAMHLAERTELHNVLYLGIARLNELLRLNPDQALQLLKEGTPNGAVATLSVRNLRCIVESMIRENNPARAHRSSSLRELQAERPASLKQLHAEIAALPPQQQRKLVQALLKKLAPEPAIQHQLELLLQRPTLTPMLGSYLPDTHSGHPKRWEALTERLEMLEVLAGRERTSFQVQLQGFNKPLNECEMVVVYLDRMFANQKEHLLDLSVSRALARILTGRDHAFNARKLQLLRLLATANQSASKKVSAFWQKLHKQVCPPPCYQEFLSQLVSEVQQQTWTFRCCSPYQAEYVQHCLEDPAAGVFWGTACAVLDVHSLRISWQEGRVEQEKVITLKGELAGVA